MRRVLIIDDATWRSKLIADALTAQGMHVDRYERTAHAITAGAACVRYDAVLYDLGCLAQGGDYRPARMILEANAGAFLIVGSDRMSGLIIEAARSAVECCGGALRMMMMEWGTGSESHLRIPEIIAAVLMA